jgi:gamma-glutamylcyclotransferase (GGCT)/AIG2-like uncharacterized protein YtfP
MNSKNYLFVYGTLRKNFDLQLKQKVSSELEYLGKAKVEGMLYDIGDYPGAIKTKSGNEIVGDVFLVSDPEKVFKILDKYEGYSSDKVDTSEFVRTRNKVQLKSGKQLNAWIYWYNNELEGKPRIKYKDYFNYLKTKKTA